MNYTKEINLTVIIGGPDRQTGRDDGTTGDRE